MSVSLVRSSRTSTAPDRRPGVRLSRTSLAVTCALCLLTLSAGPPALAQESAPAVARVWLIGTAPQGLHTLGSTVEAGVFMDGPPVVVTGRPRVAITVGAEARYAEFSSYRPEAGTGGEGLLRFRYVVQASDRDDDGISIPANALSLDGGSIKDARGNGADLSHDAVPDNPDHKVNGSLNPAPMVTRVYLEPPLSGDTYVLGEEIVARVEFDSQVVRTGQPRLMLQIGDRARPAVLHSWSRTRFGFRYVVQASDRDDDGISIPANALSLDGGSIKGSGGNDADLSHDAVPDNPAHKVNGSSAPLPTVTRVVFFGRPLSGDAFGREEEIRVRVEFSRAVTVTGNPRLVLQIGDQTRGADLYYASEEVIGFRHFVEASDRDDDGISIPANAIRPNRGSIRGELGNDADLTHEAVPDDARLKVDGRLDAVPTITSVFLSTRPRQGDTFARGEPLLAGVRFSEPVEVAGTPQLAIQVGTQTRQANLHARRGSTLFFEHVVQSSDVDADGFSVPADALALNGGSIRDADGNDADLTHGAVPDDPHRKVNGASGAPTVARVLLSGFPASQDTYAAGETIFAVVQFTRGVHVAGAPQLTMQVGTEARRAEHLPRRRAAGLLPPASGFHLPRENDHNVYFHYVVQPTDLDDDGVAVPANALPLNGGSIRAVDDDTDARLSHDAVAADHRRLVDGSRSDDQAPAVSAVTVEPPVRGMFSSGDTITVGMTFSEGVTVTGAPRFTLRIGTQTRFATFREMLDTRSVSFDYVVEESDRDDDGLSIAADAVDLNGGTIRDNAGNDADLDLGYRAFNDDPNYKVNGGLTAVPALPVGGVPALLFALLGIGWRGLARRRPERGA